MSVTGKSCSMQEIIFGNQVTCYSSTPYDGKSHVCKEDGMPRPNQGLHQIGFQLPEDSDYGLQLNTFCYMDMDVNRSLEWRWLSHNNDKAMLWPGKDDSLSEDTIQ